MTTSSFPQTLPGILNTDITSAVKGLILLLPLFIPTNKGSIVRASCTNFKDCVAILGEMNIIVVYTKLALN